jgi:hypothetical protein
LRVVCDDSTTNLAMPYSLQLSKNFFLNYVHGTELLAEYPYLIRDNDGD